MLFSIDKNFKGDRFDLSLYLEPVEGERDPLTSQLLKELIDLKPQNYHEIKVDELARPDLISYRIYGTTKLWWVLAYYNGRWNNREFKVGDMIEYPSLADLEKFYFEALQREKEERFVKPIQYSTGFTDEDSGGYDGIPEVEPEPEPEPEPDRELVCFGFEPLLENSHRYEYDVFNTMYFYWQS